MTFFMSVTCTIRILQTGRLPQMWLRFWLHIYEHVYAEVIVIQDNPYFIALIFHLSCLFVGIVI